MDKLDRLRQDLQQIEDLLKNRLDLENAIREVKNGDAYFAIIRSSEHDSVWVADDMATRSLLTVLDTYETDVKAFVRKRLDEIIPGRAK